MPRAAAAVTIHLLLAAAFVGAIATSNETAACPASGCGVHGACRNGACLCSAGWHGINDWVDTGGCNVHRYTQHVLHVIGVVFCVVTLLHVGFAALKECQSGSTCASGADTRGNAEALPSSSATAAWISGEESAVRAASTTLPSSAAWSETETVRAPGALSRRDAAENYESSVESHVAQQEPTASSGGVNLGHVLGDRRPPPMNSEETCNAAAARLSPRKRRARNNRLIVYAHTIMVCIFGPVQLLFYEGRLSMSLSIKCGGPLTISKNANITVGAVSLHSNLYRPCAIAFVPLMSIIHSIIVAGASSISCALVPSMWLNLLPGILMNRAPFLRSLQTKWATVAIPLTFGLDAVYLFLGLLPAFDTAESERLATISVKATLAITGLLAIPAASVVTIVAVKVFAMLALRQEQSSAWVVQLWKLLMSGRTRLDGGVRDRITRKLRLSMVVLNVVAGGCTVGSFLLITPTWFEYNPHIGESFLLVCCAIIVLNLFLVLFRPRRSRRLARRRNLDSTNGSVRSSVAKSSVSPHP